eukprot:Skav212625  [mRNA]  locus=scaffold173:168175:169248:+ [translate_table: standard]
MRGETRKERETSITVDHLDHFNDVGARQVVGCLRRLLIAHNSEPVKCLSTISKLNLAGVLNGIHRHFLYIRLNGFCLSQPVTSKLRKLGRALQRARALSQAKENFDESCDYFAARIFEVGKASRDAGNLDEADFCFDLSLKIWKDLHGDTDHPDIAATFYELGKVSQEAGDLRRALQCFHKSLAINLSLRQNSDQSVIAAILLELGKMSRQAVDLHQAEEHLDRCLNILRCLHKERGHPDIVATRYELLQVSLQAAKLDRSRAEQHFDKILPLLDFFGSFWSWRGDGGVNYIRGVLNEEKKASQEAQELYQVRRSLLHYSDPLPLLPSLRPKYPHISAAVHQQRGSKLLHSWFRWFR